MTLVSINIEEAGSGANAHVVVDEIGSADCWGETKADALQRAALWAAEHVGEGTVPESDRW